MHYCLSARYWSAPVLWRFGSARPRGRSGGSPPPPTTLAREPAPRRAPGLLFALLAAIALGCAVTALSGCQAPGRKAAPAAVRAVQEQSVKPGINAEYHKPGLNVAQWVERFEREGREIYDQRERILQATGPKPGSTVADIGAGSGLFTLLFARAVGPAGRVYAVDIVKDFLAHIDHQAASDGLTNVTTVLCTDRAVGLPRNSVDLAFICDTYHHFEYPRSTLQSLHQALRRGGELVVIDFKREPGRSSEWILQHVRAGQATVTAEIEAAGFQKVQEFDFLRENYMLRFRKVTL